MTAIDPFHQATTSPLPLAASNTPTTRRRAAAPPSAIPAFGLVAFGAALIAAAFALTAVLVRTTPVLAIPCGVAAVAILAGVLIPDAYGRRLDRRRAAQGTEVDA